MTVWRELKKHQVKAVVKRRKKSDYTDDLNAMAMEWQEFYNKKRPHSSLNGKTPMQKLKSVKHLVPIQPDVSEKFWESNEEILPRNYKYLKFIKHRNKKTVIR